MILTGALVHLPTDVTDGIAQPLAVLRGRAAVSDHAVSLEMAADEISEKLKDYPGVEAAFREWFVTRYPFYAR